MKKAFTLLAFLLFAVACTARNPGNEAHRSSTKPVLDSAVARATAVDTGSAYPEELSFKAGGTSISIPPPTADLVEVGCDKRQGMEILVPQNNRLLCAFVTKGDLEGLGGDDGLPVIAKYALVEVDRKAEAEDYEASDFSELADAVKKTFGDISPVLRDAEEEFNSRIRSLNLDELPVSIDRPTQLGCLFSKQDAYGYGMLATYLSGGARNKRGIGCTLLHVKKRVLFLYIYAKYENENTVRWLRTTAEEWADAILRANT